MLSVMVIRLSEMNSYRIRVAIAVLSPSSAPCLVFALQKQVSETFIIAIIQIIKISRTHDSEMSEYVSIS